MARHNEVSYISAGWYRFPERLESMDGPYNTAEEAARSCMEDDYIPYPEKLPLQATDNIDLVIEWASRLGACVSGSEWLEEMRRHSIRYTALDVWNLCERPEWLWWYMTRLNESPGLSRAEDLIDKMSNVGWGDNLKIVCEVIRETIGSPWNLKEVVR